jgi:hypothetical protein
MILIPILISIRRLRMSSEKDIDLRGTYDKMLNDASTSITNTSNKNKSQNKDMDSSTKSRNGADQIHDYVSGDAQRSSSSHQFHKS